MSGKLQPGTFEQTARGLANDMAIADARFEAISDECHEQLRALMPFDAIARLEEALAYQLWELRHPDSDDTPGQAAYELASALIDQALIETMQDPQRFATVEDDDCALCRAFGCFASEGGPTQRGRH